LSNPLNLIRIDDLTFNYNLIVTVAFFSLSPGCKSSPVIGAVCFLNTSEI
jgi:hypothetical protein